MREEDPITNVNLSVDAKKTIVFSFGGIDFNDNLKTQISLFMEKNPDIEVKILQLPNSTDYQRNSYVSAFKASDTSIDVISTDIIWTAEFANNGWVLPLENYFSEDKQHEFIQSAIDGCKFEGRIYAVPKRSDAPLLYYRKDIIPKAPATYDEMAELVRKYKSPSGIKYGYVFQGNTYEGLVCNALEFIWAYGGDVIEDGKVVINSPESINGLQKLVDIVNNDISSPDVLSFIEDDSRLAFQDGNALFMRNWPYAYKQLNSDGSSVIGNVGICELPKRSESGKRCTGTLGGWNYMINRNSKYPDESWRLIEWLTSHEMQVLDNQTGGNPPTRTKVYSNTELKEKDPLFSKMQNLIEYAHLRPVSPYYPVLTETMQLNFCAALYKDISAETAILNIDRDMNKIIEDNTP
jgi:multiple sugar transport system substrate-binding protein